MSLARHALATAASRAYLTLLGLVVLPLYLQRLGHEGYGLIVLFLALQVWFQLLDLGLTPALAREAARHRAGAVPGAQLRQLLRASERLFAAVVVLVGVGLALAADLIAARWLRLEGVSPSDAARAIEWMAAAVAVRLLGELYRAAIAGFERLGWLAGFNATFGTLRYLGVLPFLDAAGASAVSFLAYQFAVGVLELVWLAAKARRLVPVAAERLSWSDFRPLAGVLGFSAAMSVASVVWVLASQLDKLVLSGVLSLPAYGAFGVATAAASAILLAAGSLSDALLPRLTTLAARPPASSPSADAAQDPVRSLYRRTSQWVSAVAAAGAALFASQAETLLWAWTGDAALARDFAPVLALYAIGNAAMAVSAMPYLLQRWHADACGCTSGAQGRWWACCCRACSGSVFITALSALPRRGAGVNLLYLALWTPVAHRAFLPGLHGRWIGQDVAPAAIAAALGALVVLALQPLAGEASGRLAAAGQVLLAAGTIVAAVALALPPARERLWRRPVESD